jgi:hypothetical protein
MHSYSFLIFFNFHHPFFDDDEALVSFDLERRSHGGRCGGRFRQISVKVAGRAGFEPTSPAPKAGRISRLP